MKTKTNFPPEYTYPGKNDSYDDDDIPKIDLPKPKRGPLDVPEELQSLNDSENNRISNNY